MSSPFRNERDAALERVGRLEEENARLRARLEGPRRTRGRLRARLIVLAACAFALLGLAHAVRVIRPLVEARLEARRWARAREMVRMDWTDEDAGTHNALHGAWSGARGTYAVGDRGTILFRDTTGAWSRQPSGTTENLYAVDAGLTYDVQDGVAAFAVGAHGTILRYDGATRAWVSEWSGTTETLRSVAVIAWYAFAAGDHGTLLRRDTGVWTPIDTKTKADLRALYAPLDEGDTPGHTLYVAGTGGTILYLDNHFSGVVSAQRSGTDADLDAIGGLGDTVVAGGAAGTLVMGSRDSTVPWAPIDLDTKADIVSIKSARETFERCTEDAECRFLAWTPTIIATSRSGEIAALDPRVGWVRHPPQDGSFAAVSARWQRDVPKDELLLFGEDGRIRRGVPHP